MLIERLAHAVHRSQTIEAVFAFVFVRFIHDAVET